MRTPAAAIVLSGVLLATLTACTAAPAACEPLVGTGSGAATVDAAGEVGQTPEVSFPTPLISDGPQQSVLVGGDGAIVAPGGVVDLEVSLFDAASGELITATAYDEAQDPLRTTAGEPAEGSTTPLFSELVQCAEVGSRIAATATIGDVFGTGALDPALGFEDDAPVVVVIDVMQSYLGRATGTPQLGAQGVPAVVTSTEGVPGVTIPDEEAPSELRTHVLVSGGGDEIAEGDRVVLHYTGLLWDEKTVFDSSWERGAAATFTAASFEDDPNGVVPGLAEGLIGQTVGSQVIVIIPPEDGYPEGQAPASIPPGSTMVFVVDVLGIEQ